MRVGRPQVLEVATADHVVRWRRDVCDAAHPVTGVTDAAEGCQHEAGTRVGRKGLHTCQKDRAPAVIPVRRKTSLARRFLKEMCMPGTGAGWNFLATAARR